MDSKDVGLNKQFLESIHHDIAWDDCVKQLGSYQAMVFFLQAFEGWLDKRASESKESQKPAHNTASLKLPGVVEACAGIGVLDKGVLADNDFARGAVAMFGFIARQHQA